jgi:hypothetical protein
LAAKLPSAEFSENSDILGICFTAHRVALMSSNDERGRLANIRLFRFGQSQIKASAVYHRRWKALGILVFYSLLALAMLSPLAADGMPDSPAQDLANHVSGIVEARNALAEGQFPIRVAPNQNNGERYPIFQFYGNLPYTAGGLLYLAAGINPYTAWKLVIFIVLVIGAVFTYRCAALMTRRRLPAMVGGVVFLTAPYLLIDIHSRFAYPEVVSFGILPCVFFYTIRSFTSRKLTYVLLSAIAWACLALSHNITFLYASVFFSLYLLTFFRFNARYFWRMFRVGVGYGVGVLLVAWYLIPQLILLPNLLISAFPADQTPYINAWLTPLTVLLAPTLVLPSPSSSSGLKIPPRFGLQIGWPILIAFGLAFFYLYRPARLVQRSRVMIARLLLFFLITFFMVWDCVNFWIYLPKLFSYIQFSYRLLMFVVLWGALLAAYALTYALRRGIRVKHTVAVVAVLVLFAVPYLSPHTPSSQVSVDNEIHRPNMGRGGANSVYILAPSAMVATTIVRHDANLADWDYNIVDSRHRLIYPGKSEISAPQKGDTLFINGQVPIEYAEPVKFTVAIDNIVLTSVLLKTGAFSLELPITTTFTSERVQIVMQTDKYLHPILRVPALPQRGMLALEIGGIRWKSALSNLDEPLLPAAEVKKMLRAGSATTYVIPNREARLVQLPVFFYPNMLQIRDNDRLISYGNLGHFVALRLPPGDHVITAHFVGVGWANILSLLAWIGVSSSFIFMVIRYYLRNRPKVIVFGRN